jgi:hypothetical protein
MNSPDYTRKNQWTPPARPAWVQRVNEEGACLDLKSVVPLDEDSLIKAAQANTGLSDFGADDWYEPFQVLIRSYNEESSLHLMGRLMARSDLILYLEARLRIEDTYRRHPEIEDEQIVKPIVIVGQGRSGTSGLLNLLAQDPDNVACRTWQAYFPCPLPDDVARGVDTRITRADQLITQWNRVVPELVSAHEFNGEVPTETIQLHCLSFQSPSWFSMVSPAPSYVAFMAQRGVLPALQYEKRVLKLLQWQQPRKHWVLKSPDATRYMPEVMAVYPDVTLVWSHRDPVKSLSSAINTLGTLGWTRTDQPLMPGVFDHVTSADNCAAMLCQPIKLIEGNAALRASLCNVQYRDFLQTPLAVVQQIYALCGRPLTEAGRAAMQHYMDDYPRTTRPAHRYDIGPPAMVAKERQAFAHYQQYFGVPNEV